MGGAIRVGIGGWDYAPWRETFYPAEITQKRQLEYASRQLTTIEVNGTFYRLQSPAVYTKWHDATPQDFVFSLKAPRFITHRRLLASAGESIQRFLSSGIDALGDKLGPLLWQLPPTTRFDPSDLAAFLQLLPAKLAGRPLRHALEARHDSFIDAAFVDLAARHHVAIVLADSPKYPQIAAATADFVYARLMCAEASCVTGYAPVALDAWRAKAQTLASGEWPAELGLIPGGNADSSRRAPDVFIYFINGAKERAPAAAMQLLANLHGTAVRQSIADDEESLVPCTTNRKSDNTKRAKDRKSTKPPL
jgi:uncharacterized protein YecE (DUF72 family)